MRRAVIVEPLLDDIVNLPSKMIQCALYISYLISMLYVSISHVCLLYQKCAEAFFIQNISNLMHITASGITSQISIGILVFSLYALIKLN